MAGFKIKANLADVEAKYQQVIPQRYRLQIKEVKPKEVDGRQNINFEFRINDGGDFQGRPIYHNCSLHKKDGELNAIGLADYKRIAASALGKSDPDDPEINWDEVEPEDLKMMEIEADVKIEPWKNETKGTSGEGPVIKSVTVGPVS